MKLYQQEVNSFRSILSDNGSSIKSNEWVDYWTKNGVKLIYTSVYRPASNPAETVMAILGDCFRLYISEHHKRWAAILSHVEARYNIVEHDTTGKMPILVNEK